MKKIKIDREVILHIGAFFLLFVALALNLKKNEFTLGEFLFNKLNIDVWSNETTGLYYPGIFALFLSIIFFIELIFITKGINKKFFAIIIGVVLVWRILIIPAFDFGYGIVKSNEPGLASIDYIKKDSKVSYKVASEKLIIDAQINLQNFSKESKEFYVKVKPSEHFQEVGMSDVMTAVDEEGNPKKFTLAQDEISTINLKFESIESKIDNGSGSGGIDILIYNENEEREF